MFLEPVGALAVLPVTLISAGREGGRWPWLSPGLGAPSTAVPWTERSVAGDAEAASSSLASSAAGRAGRRGLLV